MEDDLTCCICSDVYTEPVTVNCGHSFCKECLTLWADKRRSQAPAEASCFPCPMCKRDVNYGILENVQVNVTLRNLSSGWKDQQKGFAIIKEGKGEAELCQLHPIEEAKFVCMTCMCILCGFCVAVNKLHSSSAHKIVDRQQAMILLQRMFDEQKTRVVDLQGLAVNASDSIRRELSQLADFEEEIDRVVDHLKKRFITAVDQYKSSCKKQVQERRKEYCNLLNGRITEIDTALLSLTITAEEDFSKAKLTSKFPLFQLYAQQSNAKKQEFEVSETKLRHLKDSKFQIKIGKIDTPALERIIRDSFSVAMVTMDDTPCQVECNVDSLQSKEKVCPLDFDLAAGELLCQFDGASNFNLHDVIWTLNDVLVVDQWDLAIKAIRMKTGCIEVIQSGSGWCHAPFGLCGVISQSPITILATSTSEWLTRGPLVISNVSSDGDEGSTTKQIPLNITAKKAVISQGSVYVITSDDKVLFGKISSSSEQTWGEFSVLQQPKDIVAERHPDGTYLFVRNHENAIQRFDGQDPSRESVSYNTAMFTKISCMASDLNGYLWVMDHKRHELGVFSKDGQLRKLFPLDVEGQVSNMFVSSSSIFLLTKTYNFDDTGAVWRVPLNVLG